MTTLDVRIAGMACQHCIRAVFTALAGVEGIERADVQLGRATIDHDGRTTLDAVCNAVRLAGYDVQGGTTSRRRLPTL
ncbi:MAG: heavy-metal-associated domain-containing protein [Gemmatimonadaceae bacterium]